MQKLLALHIALRCYFAHGFAKYVCCRNPSFTKVASRHVKLRHVHSLQAKREFLVLYTITCKKKSLQKQFAIFAAFDI